MGIVKFDQLYLGFFYHYVGWGPTPSCFENVVIAKTDNGAYVWTINGTENDLGSWVEKDEWDEYIADPDSSDVHLARKCPLAHA